MHSHYENGCLRAWLRDGRSIEASVGPISRAVLAFDVSEDHIHMALLGAQVFLPYPGSKHSDDVDLNDERRHGVAAHGEDVHVYLGKRVVVWVWPWSRWVHVRHERFGKIEEHPYLWADDGGWLRETTAQVRVEEREWRLLHPRSPIRRVQRYIDVKFADEVGRGVGSWKGGTIGCGYNMLPGESARECLERMERERHF